MSEFRLLIAQLAIVLPLTVVTWFAVEHSLYWRIWWLDMPMHIAGGLWAGLCAAWILARQGKTFTLAWCLAFAFLIGIGWEIFEYSEGLTMPVYFDYPYDTTKDLFMDLFGSVLGWMLALRLMRA
jgi:hypothetical protein